MVKLRRTLIIGTAVVLLSLAVGRSLGSQPDDSSIIAKVLFAFYLPGFLIFYFASGGVHGGVSIDAQLYAGILAENLALWALIDWVRRRLTRRSRADRPLAAGR